MRTFLILIINTVIAITVNAQPGWYDVFPGDTVVLIVSGQNGTIQWQQSTDSITWTNIAGATTTPYQLLTTSSPNNKRYFRVAVDDNCPNTTWYSSTICYRILSSTSQIQIGDWFHGGIVFYIDGAGNGLIAPQQDQSSSVQFNADLGNTINGAVSNIDGPTNTATIVANTTARPIAASVCDDLTMNGYCDWFLPAKDQLNYLYQQQYLVDGFQLDYYWSSTQWNPIQPTSWRQNFTNGFQDYTYQVGAHNVRCVRSFSSSDISAHTISTAIVTNQPVSVTLSTQPQTQNKCLGSCVTFSVVATGTASITYQWKKGGTDISGATSDTYTKSGLTLSDEGIYTCEVTNLCRSVVSDNAELKVIQVTANAGSDTRICNGLGTGLFASANSNYTTESGNYSFSWSPTTGLSASNVYNPSASPTVTTDYTVQATDQLGCTTTDVVNIFVQNPYNEQVCLVTVDTSTWKNKVMWEKTPNVGTEYYLIYKETGTNSYSQIGNVLATQTGEYVDLFSQPEVHGDKYKITVLDTCGNESDLDNCFYHKTVNLTIAAFGSTMGLNWDDYVDESGNYVPFRYYIYRGTSPINMTLHDSVSGSFNSYNDNNVYTVYYYMIGVKKSPPCNVTDSEMSFSNKKDNSNFIGDVEYNGYNLEALSIYPNPFKESTTIKFYNPDNKTFLLTLTDSKGRVIRKTENVTGKEIIIERKDLKVGMYFMELKGENKTYRGKIMIE